MWLVTQFSIRKRRGPIDQGPSIHPFLAYPLKQSNSILPIFLVYANYHCIFFISTIHILREEHTKIFFSKQTKGLLGGKKERMNYLNLEYSIYFLNNGYRNIIAKLIEINIFS